MNKFVAATLLALASFSAGTAFANDGVLFRNSNDPYFTTPTEFLVLGKKIKENPIGLQHGLALGGMASPIERNGAAANDPGPRNSSR